MAAMESGSGGAAPGAGVAVPATARTRAIPRVRHEPVGASLTSRIAKNGMLVGE